MLRRISSSQPSSAKIVSQFFFLLESLNRYRITVDIVLDINNRKSCTMEELYKRQFRAWAAQHLERVIFCYAEWRSRWVGNNVLGQASGK